MAQRPSIERGVLLQLADAKELNAQQPDRASGNQAVVILSLWVAVLTAQSVGRRYIDPGSGSFAIQITIAAVLGGLLTARLWLRHTFWRAYGLLRRRRSGEPPAGEEADGQGWMSSR